MTISSDTYIANMLELINCSVTITKSEARYPIIEPNEMRQIKTGFILLSSEPYPFREKHFDEINNLVGGDATVKLIDGELLSWYGSRAIAGVEYLIKLGQNLKGTR